MPSIQNGKNLVMIIGEGPRTEPHDREERRMEKLTRGDKGASPLRFVGISLEQNQVWAPEETFREACERFDAKSDEYLASWEEILKNNE